MLAWLIYEKIRHGACTTLGAASGAVAGLVAITPAGGSCSPLGAIAIGVIAGVLCAMAVGLKYRFGYDDSLDVVGVHLVGGVIGSLLIGFFATGGGQSDAQGLFYGGGLTQLWKQLAGVGAVLAYSLRRLRDPRLARSTRRSACGSARTTRSPASTRSSTPRPRTTSAARAVGTALRSAARPAQDAQPAQTKKVDA